MLSVCMISTLLVQAKSAARGRRRSTLSHALRPFYAPLKPEHFYFELLHTALKLWLVGFAALVAPGSMLQLLLALLVTLGFSVLILKTRPYKAETNNLVAISSSLSLVATFICLILLRCMTQYTFKHARTILLKYTRLRNPAETYQLIA